MKNNLKTKGERNYEIQTSLRVLCICASVLMLAGSALPASAGNVKDTEWNFDLSYNQTSHTTALREKTNDSSTYVYYKSGTPSSLSCTVLNSENQPM